MTAGKFDGNDIPPRLFASQLCYLPGANPQTKKEDIIRMNTLLDLISQAPGNAVAIMLPESGRKITYSELRAQVQAAADVFAGAGIRPGDRIALSLSNGLDTIVCFLAASIAGTAAPLNPAYRFDEFSFYLEDTNARLLVVPPSGGEEARRAAAGKVPVLTAEVDSGGAVRLSPSSKSETAQPPDSDGIALVLHTSGSTGRPKRVPLRHRNLVVSAQNIVRTYDLGPGDVALVAMPLFHVHGLVASTLATLLSGGSVLVPSRFNPLSFWRTVRDYRATWYSAVPTIHSLLLARAGGERPQGAENLRFIRSCSAPLSPEMMHGLEAAFGAPVLEAYGMTEASHQMSSNPLPPGIRKPGSVGPGTGVKISIMDADGNHLPSGTAGEVVIQGPNVIEGYENNPEANATSFTHGWFRTGDQGILDADGYLRLVARIKELINRGGEKISPREIDELLLSHPAIAEAVCFGTPHPTWGEEVEAAVVLKDGASEQDLLSFCKDRLADFKRPKKIHIVETIPRTATGKIQRRAVAASFAAAGEAKK
jgi:acyl-CoA synthetase (AMP-forming)/AMP-acid ligase II